MKLIKLPEDWQGESGYFLEGAVLASNLSVKPLAPETWCEMAGVDRDEVSSLLIPHLNGQHNILQRSEYSLSTLSRESLTEVAQGFMTVWPVVEEQYQGVELQEGAQRMLQALLTTLMLLIDEESTRSQMQQAGIESPPYLQDYLPRLDLMLTEAALAADELMAGDRSQSVNPYKGIGRNDKCPCGSGRKFKQCCGR